MRPFATCVLALFAAACGGSSGKGDGGVVLPRRDAAPVDLDGSDLRDAGAQDLSQATDVGDMARAWHDVSYTGGVGIHAVPDGGSLWSVWNDTAGTVMAVGDYGAILRSQAGGAFVADSSTTPGFSPAFLSVTGELPSGPAYVAGQGGALWRYTGSLTAPGAWTADEPGVTNYFYGLWVAPDGSAFSAGDGVMLIRKTDASFNWTPLSGGPTTGAAAYSIWGAQTGSGTYSIYAAGCTTSSTTCDTGAMWHSTGGAYTVQSVGAVGPLYGVWGASATDVYAVGASGVILHSTGNGTWTAQTSGVTVPLEDISGSGPDEIYIVGDPNVDNGHSTVLHKYDHTSITWAFETLASKTDAHYYFGVSATTNDVYLVGDSGAILHK